MRRRGSRARCRHISAPSLEVGPVHIGSVISADHGTAGAPKYISTTQGRIDEVGTATMADDAERSPFRDSPARRRVVRTGRALVQSPLELLDPAPHVLSRRTRDTRVPPLAVVSVYRRRFAHHLVRLQSGLPPGARLMLWGLDGIAPPLAADTLGVGEGERFVLLNRLLRVLDLEDDVWVLALDDDVLFKRGSAAGLLRAAVRFGLDLCQPVHAWNSEVSHRFTRRRALMLARRTGWVEQGPVVLFGPRARERLLPLPPIPWPGWGIEALWSREERRGLRLGMVDAVTIIHKQRVNASGYSWRAARELEERLLREAGFRLDEDLQVERAAWRPWTPAPAPAPARVTVDPCR